MADLVKSVLLKIIGDSTSADDALNRVAARAEELKASFPEYAIKIDDAKAYADMKILKAALQDSAKSDPIKVPVEPDVDQSAWTRINTLWSKLFGGGNSNARWGVGNALNAVAGAGPVGGTALLGGGLTVATLIGSAIPAIVAAFLGAGAFGALAYPTVSGFMSANSAMGTAQGNYQIASANLGTAIGQSPADMAAYKAVLVGLEPDLAHAATLLTNQNVQWQNLSPKMQNSVIALRNNSAAYKTLLPDQQKALNALIAEGNAWNSLTPAQQNFSKGTGQIANTYDAMVAKMEPAVSTIVNMGLQIANQLLPVLLPFAQAVAPVIEKLLGQFSKFTVSPGFHQFIAEMTKLSGPALLAIGQGIGQVAGAVGNLLIALANPTSVETLKLIFQIIAMSINAFAKVVGAINWVVQQAKILWKEFGHDMANWAQNVENWISGPNGVMAIFKKAPGLIAQALSGLPGILYSIGHDAMTGLLHGLESVPVVGGVASIVGDLVGHAKSALGIHSPSTVAMGLGRNFTQGFYIGLSQAGQGVGVSVTGVGAASGAGNIVGVLRFEGGDGPLTLALVQALRGYVHSRGGGPNSVQRALGTT